MFRPQTMWSISAAGGLKHRNAHGIPRVTGEQFGHLSLCAVYGTCAPVTLVSPASPGDALSCRGRHYSKSVSTDKIGCRPCLHAKPCGHNRSGRGVQPQGHFFPHSEFGFPMVRPSLCSLAGAWWQLPVCRANKGGNLLGQDSEIPLSEIPQTRATPAP